MLKDGKIFAEGDKEVINQYNIKEVYGVDVYIGEINGIPVIVPKK